MLRTADAETPLAPTHWSFGQLCALVGAPAGYLRGLPAALAASISSTGSSATGASR